MQFYSNSDLATFLQLSGLPNASIPISNVYGDLENDETRPGGEAQLDVEYIMVSVWRAIEMRLIIGFIGWVCLLRRLHRARTRSSTPWATTIPMIP